MQRRLRKDGTTGIVVPLAFLLCFGILFIIMKRVSLFSSVEENCSCEVCPPPVLEDHHKHMSDVDQFDSNINKRPVPIDTRQLQSWNSPPRNDEEKRLEKLLLEAAMLAPPGFPNTVILLLCNNGFHEMLLNFLHFAHRTVPPVYNYVIFPLDSFEYTNLTKLNVDRIYWPEMGNNFSPRPRNFRSGPYNQIVQHKFYLAEIALSLGFNAFVVDVDNVFVRNPFNFFLGYNPCDFMAVTDSVSSTIKKEQEDRWNFQGHQVYINTGFILWQNKKVIIDIVRDVLRRTKSQNTDDQDLFCEILDEKLVANAINDNNPELRNFVNVPVLKKHEICSNLGGVKAQILPPGLFGGQKLVLQTFQLALAQMTPPYVIHFGHLAGFFVKRDFMIEQGFWNLTIP